MRCGKRGRFGWKEKKRRQERVGSVAADPDNVENRIEIVIVILIARKQGGKHKVQYSAVQYPGLE